MSHPALPPEPGRQEGERLEQDELVMRALTDPRVFSGIGGAFAAVPGGRAERHWAR